MYIYCHRQYASCRPKTKTPPARHPYQLRSSSHQLRLPVLFVILAPLLAACSPKYYVPNTHNVPLLRQKADATVSGAIGDGRVEAQGSYAFSDNVGVLLSGAFYRLQDDEDGDGGSGNFIEAGVGYFSPVGTSFGFETYGLLGVGDLENHFPSTLSANPGTSGILEGRVVRLGGQTAFGFRTSYLEAAASVRLTSLRYQDVTGSLIFNSEDQVVFLQLNDSYVMLEPAFTIRAGSEILKVQIQFGVTANLTNSELDQDEGHLTLGIVYFPSRQGSSRN